MSLTYLEVVRVMAWCNLNNTCSEFSVNIFISNNRNLTIHKWQHNLLANDVLVSLIIRMNCNSSITKHCLWSCCGELNVFATLPNNLVSHMPEVTSLLFVLNLGITNCSLTYRAEINNLIALVYLAFLVELNEYVFNCLRAALIHGESFSLPVSCRTYLLKLINDSSAVFFLPIPAFL